MDFNSRFDDNRNFKIFVVAGLIVIALIIIGIIIFTSEKPEIPAEPDLPERVVVEPDKIEIEPEIIEEDESISRLIAKVTKIRDLGTKIEYYIEIGLGENKEESVVTADSKTRFFNFSSKSVVLPSEVTVGDDLIIYATGKYIVGDLRAKVLGVGTDTTYSFGEVDSIALNGAEKYGYIWTLKDSNDKLIVTESTLIYDAIDGSEINSDKQINKYDKILYKGKIENVENNVVCYCDEIYVVR